MECKVLRLNCITNMHVGNGDVNYNIIDNEVERDAITGYPTINASGVKGALRIYMDGKTSSENIKKWFGAEGNDGSNGQVKILGANMLAMPVRASKGKNAYYLVTTKEMIDSYKNMAKNLNFTDRLSEVKSSNENAYAEEIEIKDYYEIDGKKLFIVPSDKFGEIALPVIARNKLDPKTGESKNLWYEEVVPHESIFYIPVIADTKEMINDFTNVVSNQLVQFGGNASIGYGLCKVTVE